MVMTNRKLDVRRSSSSVDIDLRVIGEYLVVESTTSEII